MKRLSFACFVVGLMLASSASAATIKVSGTLTSISEDGECSLREAFISANKNVSRDACKKGERSRDTIKLKGVEFFVTGSTDEDESVTGDLDYTGGGPLEIRGKGMDETFINATIADDRALHATGNARSLKLRDLTIRNGEAPEPVPPGTSRGGNLLVESGSLSLNRVLIDDGTAEAGGGVYFSSVEEPRRGITINRSVFQDNTAIDGGGLQLNAFEPAKARIRRTTFVSNTAVGESLVEGGAINSNSDRLEVSDSTFLGNRAEATDDSGGVALGGAISIGGSYEKARIQGSMFQENAATQAEGTARGGAIYSGGLKTNVVNSTLYDNSSDGTGGGIHGRSTVSHVTFLLNSAGEEGDHVSASGFPVTLRNSILPGAAIAVDVCGDTPDAVSKGYNVFSYDDPDCGTLDSDITDGGNAGLRSGPAENGGPTETIGITSTSVAKDLIPKRECKSAKGVDQRGYKRPRGPRCDAGAYEEGSRP